MSSAAREQACLVLAKRLANTKTWHPRVTAAA